jgi:hypothetical protein
LAYLRTAKCEIGCQAARKNLPIFGCAQHGECSPWKFQQDPTVMDCVGCMATVE